MNKTLKQILEETNLIAFQDIDTPTKYEKSWIKIETLEAVKEWLTQKRPLFPKCIDELLEDLK